MSQLYDMRADLAAAIVAAEIGWTADTIILKRQTDLWNDVATAVELSASRAVLHLGVAEGTSTEDEGLEIEMSIPLTILCLPELEEGATPEEDLWEALVTFMHGLQINQEPYSYRFRFKSFQDLEIGADGGTGYLGRQTIFLKKMSL